jgi:NTP pyrophosphatase (non-canonical NTP hydrolase)
MNGPYSIGSDHWPGLSKLIEECGEVQQVVGKLLGNNGESKHWDGGIDLRERLQNEMADLMAALNFVVEVNGLDKSKMMERATLKINRFRGWHRDQGDLPQPVVDATAAQHDLSPEAIDKVRARLLDAIGPLITTAPVNDPYQRGICDARTAILEVLSPPKPF